MIARAKPATCAVALPLIVCAIKIAYPECRMLFGTIDFPEEILRARDAGELVVFAGAGVSMPPPSSLPSFRGLADQIGEGSGIAFENNEAADRYLGRLKLRGINVYEASKNILVNDHTEHHALHRLLFDLFPSRDAVRLVTTNFDTHFSTAARELYGTEIPTFFAPALPLGNDFTGLVYLHGCASEKANRCVLTDEDFGRAYLTEAWAARFIASMFSQYVVVFVGYSFKDTVMNYLARGLPPRAQKKRFAFTLNNDDDLQKWEHLSIKPLLYLETSGVNSHQAITDSVAKFVEVLSLGLLGQAQRIESIPEAPPPLEGEDSDYLTFSITKLETARIFFRHIRPPKIEPTHWLIWMDNHGLLKPLFDPQAKLEEWEYELSIWLAEQFVAAHPQELLSSIHRNGGRLHQDLCFHIWGVLFRRESNPKIPSVFSQWTALLLSQDSDVLSRSQWGFLLIKCHIPADKTVALLLFDRLTRPRVILDEELDFSEDVEEVTKRVAFGLNLLDDRDMWTADGWQNVLKPNLSTLAVELEPIVSSHLTAAHSLMNLANVSDYDPLYIHRESIESKGTITTLLDVLVDAARDIIILLVDTDQPKASALMERWFATETPILRRLAVFGYSIRTDREADDKLQWLLTNDLLYRFHTEVIAVLNVSYALSSRNMRRELLNRVTDGPASDVLDEEWKLGKTHRLLIRLSRLAPDCALTLETLKSFLERYPQFVQKEKTIESAPAISNCFMDQRGGFDIDVIVATPPSDFLEELLLFHPEAQRAYCNAASSAAESRPEWGTEWIKNLIERNLDQPNLWTCIPQGWRASNLSPEQWHFVLSVVVDIESPPKEFFEALIELLVEGTKRESFKIPDAEMELAQEVATLIWQEALAYTPVDESRPVDDWVAVAINNPGGRLAEFWLQRILAVRRLSGDAWSGIPPDIVLPLQTMISGTSGSSAHVRIVLASQVHYFFSIDSRYTCETLLSLYDWKQDALRAQQSWHGFLTWGRLQPGLLEALLPHFTDALCHIASFPKTMRDRLAERASVVAMYGSKNPLDSEFLIAAFQHFEEPDLIQFACGIGNLLERAEGYVVDRVWNGWLKEYWRRRALGLPKPVFSREADIMASWTIDLRDFFPEAVMMLALFEDRLSFESSRILIDLEEKEMIKKYPEAAADLILLYLKSPRSSLFGDQHTRKLWSDLKDSGLPQEKLRKVHEEMFRKLGFDPEDL